MPNQRDAFSEFDDYDGGDDFFQGVGDDSEDEGGKPPAEEMVPKSRMDEVLRQRDDAVQVRDTIIRSALAGKQSDGAASDEGEEVDPETYAAIAPIMKKFREDLLAEFGPALNAADRRANLDVLNGRVDGFEDQLMPRVEEAYTALPPELQKEYGTRVGMEALAKDLMIQDLKKQLGQHQRFDRSGMAATAPSGGARNNVREMTEDDVWRLPQEKFEKLRAGRIRR